MKMGYTLLAALATIGLFGGMLIMVELGRWAALRRMAKDPEGLKAGVGAVVGAIFSLLGLLIAFSFSGAASRFDARRQLSVQEANAIGKAYYLLDLVPEPAQTGLKESFRKYLDAELEAIRKLPDIAAAEQAIGRRSAWQRDIQSQTLAVCKNPSSQSAGSILLPAITQWVDISSVRTIAANTHPPILIFAMLMGLALISSLIAGYGMAEAKSRSWLHIIAFAAVVSLTIYVIVDLEFPRFGFIRIDAADQLLVELRASMK
jgi:hypothetical protein